MLLSISLITTEKHFTFFIPVHAIHVIGVRLGWTDYHTFVSYFQGFQMSTISRVFGLQL